jgi:protein-S-isoprenylcysteine O-methyltransferase Ste14
MSLGVRLAIRFSLGLIVGAAILFVPAGSWKFWQGWIYLAVFFTPIIGSCLYFLKHDPQLLERRLQSKEKTSAQRSLVAWFKPLFFVVYLLPGLDRRMGWSRVWAGPVPPWLSLLSDALVLLGLLFVVWVMRVNSFASRTIQVEAGQKVISRGPYGMVRHPMYLGSLVMWLSTPLALGSFVALPAFATLIPFYVLRLLNEEKVLDEELPGYAEYRLRTRYRLIPLVW